MAKPQFKLSLEEQTHRDLKALAALERRTIGDMVAKLLHFYKEKNEAQKT